LWEWQVAHGATDVVGITRTFTDSTLIEGYLRAGLTPWDEKKFEQLVDLTVLDIGYTPGSFSHTTIRTFTVHAVESIPVGPSKAVKAVQHVVWVKGIDRRFIPGSFIVTLFGKPKSGATQRIGSQFFFQSDNPMKCHGCKEKPTVDFAFNVNSTDFDFSFKIRRTRNNQDIPVVNGNVVMEISSQLLHA